MNNKILLLFTSILFSLSNMAYSEITVTGELEALKTDGYSPPRVKGIWQYTISYMAEDGSIVKPGMPVLMFKTDAIQTKLVDAININRELLIMQSIRWKGETFDNNGSTRERERVCEHQHKPAGTFIYRLCGRAQLMDLSNKKWTKK